MSPQKSKKSRKEKEVDIEDWKLTRKPLYPDLTSEKENMENISPDDSPEKFPNSRSPRMPRKSNSPLSTDSMQDIPGSPIVRNRRLQQNQMNNLQDGENADVDMETDDIVDKNHLQTQSQKMSAIPPGKLKEHLSPETGRFENLMDARRKKLNQPQMQYQRTEHSAVTSSRAFLENNLFLIFSFVILFICMFGLYMLWTKHSDTPNVSDQFSATTLVNNLKSKFKDQPPVTFRIIHVALRKVLELQPEAPAILLLLATNGSENVCHEFAHSLVNSLPASEHTVKISGKDYKLASANKAKKDIDKAISETLNKHELGSVLIDDLDQIPGQAALILHTYTDHENAPFKKAIFVMTINYNKPISDHELKVWDKAANDHLLSVWTDIDIDRAMPLLSRLTVSVAVITSNSLK